MVKGPDAFCPKSGAPLSDDRHPDERRRPHREPESDECAELSTGAVRSSTDALIAFFRRSHRDSSRDLDRPLLRKAARHLRTLKSESDARDEWIWYALCEKLHREDFEVAWMRYHVHLVCPYCGSEPKWEPAPCGDLLPKCAVNCTDSSEYVLHEARERIRTAYNAAWGDTPADHIDSGELRIA